MTLAVDPRGEVQRAKEHGTLTPRPATLNGKVIGFLDNQKWNVGPLYDRMEEMIRARYDVKGFVRLKTHFARKAPQPVIDQLVEQCDIVINGVGD